MARRWQVFLLLLVLGGGTGWWCRRPIDAWSRAQLRQIRQSVGPAVPSPQPDPTTYAMLAAELESSRTILSARHSKAKSAAARAAVEGEARRLLERSLPPMMRCWLGTPWDFNGTAGKPGAGKIACGYFVSTVLKDAGFRVNRYQLAQQPSANILRSFVAKEACTLTVGRAYDSFAGDLRSAEPGIYLVGLDTHVAFIVVAAGDFRFIHSSGARPWCVVDESPLGATVLQRSNWRMLANLTADPTVIRRWLGAHAIVVKRA
jgi:hypothetical protein